LIRDIDCEYLVAICIEKLRNLFGFGCVMDFHNHARPLFLENPSHSLQAWTCMSLNVNLQEGWRRVVFPKYKIV